MYNIDVIVDGKVCRKYAHNGKLYVEGRRGTPYKLRLTNGTNRDAEFVVSIDGLSVVDGKTASKASTGYVVSAYRTVEIDGWLVNDTTAAEFTFASKKHSYAEGKSKGENAGVIGLMVFPRKQYYSPAIPLPVYDAWIKYRDEPWSGGYFHTTYSGDTSQFSNIVFGAAPMNSSITASVGQNAARSARPPRVERTKSARRVKLSAEPETSLGTEFGDAVNFSTNKTHFIRKSDVPAMTFALYYGDARDLNALGIQLEWQKESRRKRVEPHPFPGDYCEIPADWTPSYRPRRRRHR